MAQPGSAQVWIPKVPRLGGALLAQGVLTSSWDGTAMLRRRCQHRLVDE